MKYCNSPTAARSCLRHLLIIALSSFWAFHASAAPKTDIVIFKNGDKLTGEFESLKRGQLSLNTDATGSINIEWNKVLSVVSNQRIQVETNRGIRYFGNLISSNEGVEVVVVTDNGPRSLDAAQVILMTPIEGRGIHALDIDLSVGYDFAKAGGIEHASIGVDMDFRSLTRIESLRFSTVITDSDTQENSRRTNLALQHTRLLKKRRFITGSLTFDQNDELGLNLRTSFGGGFGRYLAQSNSMLLSLEAGLQFSREDQQTDPEDIDSLEAIFTANWDWFLFDDPELDWSTRFQLIPSLTESDRVRGELDTTLSWEIIGDLKWALSVYGSWDNQPTSPEASTSDYGVNTTLIYEF